MNDRTTKQFTTALIASGIGVGLLFVLTKYRKNIRDTISRIIPGKTTSSSLRNLKVEVIHTQEECRVVLERIKSDCQKYPVLGFDTEWVTLNGNKQPIALLQLSTARGLTALVRLCFLKQIPLELREILENEDILKVGVAPIDDARYLSSDYAVGVASTLDLRYMAVEAKVKPEGLGNMSKAQLGIELDKDWRIRCSDWEADTLTSRQIDYAAKDAYVAIELFKKFAEIISPKGPLTNNSKHIKHVFDVCDRYLDIHFKNISNITLSNKASLLAKNGKSGPNKEFKRYKPNTLRRPMYDNIRMEAPDGELLCTCDKSKAEWYVEKNLATVISQEPFTIRLLFEPAGRAVGDVGKYYTIAKENRCVVCGKEESFIRKNVIPRDYRKHFPVVMKDHSSHDVLLLCITCHQKSNISDLRLRQKLAEICEAPLQDGSNTKYIEVDNLKKLKSASRALLYNGHLIPEERKKILEQEILKHLPEENEVTVELLEEYVDIDIYKKNESYQSHGKKVVEHFVISDNGGLIQLERMWREHFLNTMKPNHLPELWSIDHNVRRLEIRADEGRVQATDLVRAGLAPELLTQSLSTKNSTLDDASTLKEIEIQTQYMSQIQSTNQYMTAKSDDDATDASLSSFKSLCGTLESFHPEDETLYESDDSASTLTQPSSTLDMDSN
uniref:Exonuclease 3'-5' domain-containing protein 2 n=1 Tax=Culicoides sonorensis TaxID=179676 RepID=A0A336JZY7_CULSO